MFETIDVSVRYGAVHALSDVSLRIEPGELVGLMGANGAGKTTFIDAVTGFAASTGRVLIDGTDASNLPPHKRTRLGLGRTWQGGELFEDLTVRDNLRVASEPVRMRHAIIDALRPWKVVQQDRVDEVLERLKLTSVADDLPSNLPQGQRKLVGVARVLASSPHTICLDEPAAGLSTSEGRLLGLNLRAVAESGVGLLLVEHDVDLVLSICDRVYVLEQGRMLAEGTPREIRNNDAVIESYLGDSARAEAHQPLSLAELENS